MTPRKPGARPRSPSLKWPGIIATAKAITESYTVTPTLRQLFYRLVSLPTGHPGKIPNSMSYYNTLCILTTDEREQDNFPDLTEGGRRIIQSGGYDSPAEKLRLAPYGYQRVRDEGQEYQLFIAVEKQGLVSQLASWFAADGRDGRVDLGVPIFSLGGFSSETLAKRVSGACTRRRQATDPDLRRRP